MEVHIARAGRTIGVFNSDRLQELATHRVIRADDDAWIEGAADWLPLTEMFPDIQIPTPKAHVPATEQRPTPATTKVPTLQPEDDLPVKEKEKTSTALIAKVEPTRSKPVASLAPVSTTGVVAIAAVPMPKSWRGPAKASWIILFLACAAAVVPFLGFASWLVAGPLLTIVFILAVVVIARGGTGQGILILLNSMIIAPVFIVFAPIVSSFLGLAGGIAGIGAVAVNAEKAKHQNAPLAMPPPFSRPAPSTPPPAAPLPAYSKALVTQSIAHARQIATCMRLYSSDHGGRYPASLEDLARSGAVSDMEILHCPLLGDNSQLGYLYFAAKMTDSDAGNKIILMSKALVDGKRVVVTNDTSTSFMVAPAPVDVARAARQEPALPDIPSHGPIPDGTSPSTASATSANSDGQALLQSGYKKLQNKDLDGAIADYTAVLGQNPQSFTAYNNRGKARQTKGDLEGALADFNRAQEIDPKSALPYVNRGGIELGRNEIPAASTDFSRALELDPKNGSAYAGRALVNVAKERWDDVIIDCTEVLRCDANFTSAYLTRAQAYFRKGDTRAELADYLKLTEKDEGLWIGPNNAAWIYATAPRAEFRDGAKALQYARQGFDRSNGEQPFALGTLAAAYAEVGDFDQAMFWSKRKLELGKLSESEIAEEKQRLALYQNHRAYHQGATAGLSSGVESLGSKPAKDVASTLTDWAPKRSVSASVSDERISKFVVSHHEKASLGDVDALARDYAGTVEFLGKTQSRSEIRSGESDYHRKWDHVVETPQPPFRISRNGDTISVAYTSVYRTESTALNKFVKGANDIELTLKAGDDLQIVKQVAHPHDQVEVPLKPVVKTKANDEPGFLKVVLVKPTWVLKTSASLPGVNSPVQITDYLHISKGRAVNIRLFRVFGPDGALVAACKGVFEGSVQQSGNSWVVTFANLGWAPESSRDLYEVVHQGAEGLLAGPVAFQAAGKDLITQGLHMKPIQ